MGIGLDMEGSNKMTITIEGNIVGVHIKISTLKTRFEIPYRLNTDYLHTLNENSYKK